MKLESCLLPNLIYFPFLAIGRRLMKLFHYPLPATNSAGGGVTHSVQVSAVRQHTTGLLSNTVPTCRPSSSRTKNYVYVAEQGSTSYELSSDSKVKVYVCCLLNEIYMRVSTAVRIKRYAESRCFHFCYNIMTVVCTCGKKGRRSKFSHFK
jgi:hypothetical protein